MNLRLNEVETVVMYIRNQDGGVFGTVKEVVEYGYNDFHQTTYAAVWTVDNTFLNVTIEDLYVAKVTDYF